jgi:hypothetical protein
VRGGVAGVVDGQVGSLNQAGAALPSRMSMSWRFSSAGGVGSSAARRSGMVSSAAWVSAASRGWPVSSSRCTAHHCPSLGTTTCGTSATTSSTSIVWPNSSLASAR